MTYYHRNRKNTLTLNLKMPMIYIYSKRLNPSCQAYFMCDYNIVFYLFKIVSNSLTNNTDMILEELFTLVF